MYHAVVTNVTYGCYVQEVEYANHAIKCYRNRLEALCKEHPQYHGCHGPSETKMNGACQAIKMHQKTETCKRLSQKN